MPFDEHTDEVHWHSETKGAAEDSYLERYKFRITMLHLTINRLTFTKNSTIGEMWVNGVKQFVTLEPAWDPTSTKKPRAIPEGTYKVQLLWSDKFNRVMPHVMDVPGFQAIEIHFGNFPKDTEGCTLVGMTVDRKPDMIDTSRAAFDKLFVMLQDARLEGIEAQYINAGLKIEEDDKEADVTDAKL